jgi:uncharacterized paraquat-inducible protein A
VRASRLRKIQQWKAESELEAEDPVALRKHSEEGIMQPKPKDVACACGHITNLTTRKLRCIKCGKDVFYDENEKKLHRRQSLYVAAIIVMALSFVAYFFIEMVLGPLLLLIE